MTERLPIIGADLMMIDKLAQRLKREVSEPSTKITDAPDRRGRCFEVLLDNDRVARVIVELDRVEHGLAERVEREQRGVT